MDNVPYINGKPCSPAPEGHYSRLPPLADAFEPWLCPECGAALGKGNICLNLCSMTVAAKRRFDAMYAEAAQRVAAKQENANVR